jgi:hypothetical protein
MRAGQVSSSSLDSHLNAFPPGGRNSLYVKNRDRHEIILLGLQRMRTTLKSVNNELARMGHTARLAKGSGYFYFQFGEAADWLDRTVTTEKIGSLTVPEWIEEFRRLRKLNEQIMPKASWKTGRSAVTNRVKAK